MGVADRLEQTMNKQDVAEVLAKPYSQQLLDSATPARFAYTGLDGGPRVVPLGYFWTGTAFVISTVPKSAKVNALRKDPRVTITVEPEWAKLLDFETTLPKAVEDLILERQSA